MVCPGRTLKSHHLMLPSWEDVKLTPFDVGCMGRAWGICILHSLHGAFAYCIAYCIHCLFGNTNWESLAMLDFAISNWESLAMLGVCVGDVRFCDF